MNHRTEFVEIRLGGVPCWECGQPAYSFIPSYGVRHRFRWCWFASAADAPPQMAANADPKVRRNAA